MIRVTVPVKIVSTANLREHWAAKHRRARGQKEAVLWALAGIKPIEAPKIAISIVRIGGRRMDDDNLANGCKAVRDAVAQWLRIDDGSDRLAWSYGQRKQPNTARVEISVEAAECLQA